MSYPPEHQLNPTPYTQSHGPELDQNWKSFGEFLNMVCISCKNINGEGFIFLKNLVKKTSLALSMVNFPEIITICLKNYFEHFFVTFS